MTKVEFVKMAGEHAKASKWLRGTFDVEGKSVRIIAFARWVKLFECGNVRAVVPKSDTDHEFKENLRVALEGITK